MPNGGHDLSATLYHSLKQRTIVEGWAVNSGDISESSKVENGTSNIIYE